MVNKIIYTKEELNSMLLTLFTKEHELKREIIKTSRTLLGMGVVLILLGLIGKYQQGIAQYGFLIIVGLGIVVFQLIAGKDFYTVAIEKKYLKQMLKQMGGEEALRKECTINIDNNSLIMENDIEKITLSLDTIQSIQESETMIYIKFEILRGLVMIPKRVFESKEEKEEFLKELRLEDNLEYENIEDYKGVLQSKNFELRMVIAIIAVVVTIGVLQELIKYY